MQYCCVFVVLFNNTTSNIHMFKTKRCETFQTYKHCSIACVPLFKPKTCISNIIKSPPQKKKISNKNKSHVYVLQRRVSNTLHHLIFQKHLLNCVMLCFLESNARNSFSKFTQTHIIKFSNFSIHSTQTQ